VEALNKTALVLVIIGAIVWLIVGLFNYNIVDAIFPGTAYFVARIIYVLVGIAGLYSIALLFSPRNRTEQR
jgi:uncharacterized membrane protein YuzA (DUF378 family)